MGSLAWAEVPSLVNGLITKFVTEKNPDWKNSKIQISINGGEEFFSKTEGIPKIKYVIPAMYNLSKVTPNMILPIEAVEGHKTIGKTMLTVKIEVIKDVVLAKNLIRKGALITDADLQKENRDISLYPGKFYTDNGKVAGKITTTMIPQGSIILEWMVQEKPSVYEGGLIKIVAQSDGIIVSSSGTALSNGKIGDIINIKRNGSNDKIKARIISEDTVEVEM